MSTLGLMLSLFMTLVFTSCQVKDASSDNGLYSGHSPTGNNFTLLTPTSKVYVAGEKLTLNLTFPFEIVADTTGGSPQLKLTAGTTVRYATRVANADPKKLTFEYTFQSGDDDSNGIVINALELNGSTLKFDHDGVMTDCNIASISNKTLAGVKVDTTGPTITNFSLTNLPSATAILGTGKKLTFSMTFSENVRVSGGVPSFDIDFDTGTGTATYVSGTGTNVLNFEYTITSSVMDLDGYEDISTPLNIGAGTIKDTVGNNADLDFAALIPAVLAYSAGVRVGGQYPSIVDVTFPANKTYVAAEALDFVFEFDRDVNVTGSPFLTINVGSTTTTPRQAQYVPAANPTRVVTFRYTTVPGDVDANGITVSASLDNNSGTANIRDAAAPNNSFFTTNINTYTVPATTGIILNAIQPQAITVTRGIDSTIPVWGSTVADNIWIIGQEMVITVGFNTPVTVDQTLGTPRLALNLPSGVKYAPYLSGSGQANLVFKYVVTEGDLDTDGTITFNNIDLNGGNIVDASMTNILLTMPATGLTTTRIDGVRPTVSAVTAPANQVYSNQAAYARDQYIYTATWTEPVHLASTASIASTAGATSIPLSSFNNDVAAITFRPTATTFAANISASPVLGTTITGSTVSDQAGNAATNFTFTAPNTASITIDTTVPTVTSITATTAAGTYKSGDIISFNVTFSESVTVLASGTYPRIQMDIGGTSTRYMIAATSGTGTTHVFRYTVSTGDLDTDGIGSRVTIQHQTNGYVRDAGRNNVTPSILQSYPGINVDAVAPTFTGSSKTANGTYDTGDTLQISLQYSEVMTVDTTGGTPRISVTIGSTARNFNYVSGTGTNTLVFNYTLVNTDFDTDGLPTVNTLVLGGGTIKDTGGNNSPTSFATYAVDMSSIYVMFDNITAWFQNTGTNRAKSPAGFSYTASGTLDNCGSANNCRRMNTGSLSAAGANGVRTVFFAFKTPASFNGSDQDIFGNNVRILEDAVDGDYNLSITGATAYTVDGAATTDLNLDTVYVLQIDYAGESFNGTLMDNSFEGSLGDIFVVSGGTITGAQKNTIRNYLLTRFP